MKFGIGSTYDIAIPHRRKAQAGFPGRDRNRIHGDQNRNKGRNGGRARRTRWAHETEQNEKESCDDDTYAN